METFEEYVKERDDVELSSWQKEAAAGVIKVINKQNALAGCTGKTFLLQRLLDYVNEHGNERDLA